MVDEFPVTRAWLNVMQQVTAYARDVLMRRLYGEIAAKIMSECESALDALDADNANASPENWPPMIRELLESADTRQQLQERYAVWSMDVAEGLQVYGKEDLVWLVGRGGNCYANIDICSTLGRACKVLDRVREFMCYFFILMQELKLEYHLQDAGDYRLSSSFRGITKGIKYVDFAAEEEERRLLNSAKNEDDDETEGAEKFSTVLSAEDYKKIFCMLLKHKAIPDSCDITYFVNVVRTGLFGRLFRGSESKNKLAVCIKTIAKGALKGTPERKNEYKGIVCSELAMSWRDLTRRTTDENFVDELRKIMPKPPHAT